jgi:shikimate dehydrogenase
MPTISGTTRVFGIFGRPVAHSLSPAMHNAAFQALGVDAVYVAFPVTDLEQAVAGLRGLNLGGVSVTIPFKEDIMDFIDEMSPDAALMGAINTVVNREGRLWGDNTDWLGVVAALEEQTAIAKEHFLILGAGGAARAIAYGVTERGGTFTVTDLDPARARSVARDAGGEAVSLGDLAHCRAGVLINATPVGMAPNPDATPLDPDLLGRFHTVMDIVYRPLQTRLLREAQARGCKTIDGLRMLIHQAEIQFQLFTGLTAPRDLMAQAAYGELAAESL